MLHDLDPIKYLQIVSNKIIYWDLSGLPFLSMAEQAYVKIPIYNIWERWYTHHISVECQANRYNPTYYGKIQQESLTSYKLIIKTKSSC